MKAVRWTISILRKQKYIHLRGTSTMGSCQSARYYDTPIKFIFLLTSV